MCGPEWVRRFGIIHEKRIYEVSFLCGHISCCSTCMGEPVHYFLWFDSVWTNPNRWFYSHTLKSIRYTICAVHFEHHNATIFEALTVKLDAEFVLQVVMLLLIQLFAIKLLQLSLNVLLPPRIWLLLSSNGWFAVISLSRFRFRLIFSFIDLTSSRVASIKYRRLFNSFWSILNLLRFFSTIGIYSLRKMLRTGNCLVKNIGEKKRNIQEIRKIEKGYWLCLLSLPNPIRYYAVNFSIQLWSIQFQRRQHYPSLATANISLVFCSMPWILHC